VADVLVCPLRIGGGIKVKVIEALRRGKAIVSTGIGAQGLPAQARDALIVADDPRQFAAAVADLLRDEPRRARLERRAAAAARSLPTWNQAAAALAALYDALLERHAGTELAGSHLAGRSA
jgi:glycosyltransferase involved in cell wall biosynthesis